MSLVFDAGALIALERDDRRMWRVLKLAVSEKTKIFVPSTVVAQVWRGTPKQATVAMALALCEISPFDPLARKVGELCGRTRTADICDAQVALVASEVAEIVYTSDPGDIARLIASCPPREIKILRC